MRGVHLSYIAVGVIWGVHPVGPEVCACSTSPRSGARALGRGEGVLSARQRRGVDL